MIDNTFMKEVERNLAEIEKASKRIERNFAEAREISESNQQDFADMEKDLLALLS